MTKKKHKLRLRKQVIVALPVCFITCIITFLMITNVMNKTSNVAVAVSNIESSLLVTDEDSTVTIADTKWYKAFKEFVDFRQKDNTIIYYAERFNLNLDKTLEIAHTLTNNYEDSEYLKDYVIAPKKLKSSIGSFSSFEAGVVYFVRNLYSYPENYGSSIEEIRLDETTNTKKNYKNGSYYLENGMTFEQYLGKLCDLYGIPKDIALSIVYLETGRLTSNLFLNNNNIGGQRGIGGWMSFTTLEAGTMSFVIGLRNMIEENDLDLTKDEDVAKLSGLYVYGNLSKVSDSWVSKVQSFKREIDGKDLFS